MISAIDISNNDVMDLRDLRSFVTVARTGSFTTAARELGYTQSAVSQQVAALESSVGRVLLLRRPVRLTPAGARLAEHAAHILLRLDVAASELAHVDGEPHSLRVACTPLAPVHRIAAALRGARRAAPGVSVIVDTTDAATAATAVSKGRADLAFVDGIVAPGNPLSVADAGLLASFAVVEEPVAIIVPTDHPLRVAAVALDALIDAQWISAPALTAGVAAIAGLRAPVAPTAVTVSGADLATVLALVAAGHGLAMLPARVCSMVNGIRAIEVSSPVLVHRTELLVLKNATARHQQLIDAVRV